MSDKAKVKVTPVFELSSRDSTPRPVLYSSTRVNVTFKFKNDWQNITRIYFFKVIYHVEYNHTIWQEIGFIVELHNIGQCDR